MKRQIKREGLVSIIKYDPIIFDKNKSDETNEMIVWKHPSEDFRMGT